jgi:hypothetical protein
VAAAPYSDDFSHIYAEAYLDGSWVALDAARPQVSFGQAPEMFKRRAEWPITGTEVGTGGYLHGMAGLGDTSGAPLDWVAAIGTETSSIIQSLRASPQNLGPGAVLLPSGAYGIAPPGGTGLNVSSNISPLEIGVGLVLFVMAMKYMGRT